MEMANQVRILNEPSSISLGADTLKSMNPIILRPAVGKIIGQTGLWLWFRQPVVEKENSEFNAKNMKDLFESVTITFCFFLKKCKK